MAKRLKLYFFLISFFISINIGYTKQIGFGVGYCSENAILLNLNYKNDLQIYSFGYNIQSSDTRGKLVSEQKSNYGKTIDGNGSYFWTIDVGIGYYLTKIISIQAELSIGSLEDYTNYMDRRFKDNGYHMIDNSETIIGIGALIGYDFSKNIRAYAGYNSLKRISFGLQYFLSKFD